MVSAACGNCDRRTTLGAADLDLVRAVLSGIAQAGERFGRRKIVAMLAGEVDGLPEALARLPATGALRGEQPRALEHWIDAACGTGLIRVSGDQYRTLSLTPLGRDVMDGRAGDVRAWRRPWRVWRRAGAARREIAGPLLPARVNPFFESGRPVCRPPRTTGAWCTAAYRAPA